MNNFSKKYHKQQKQSNFEQFQARNGDWICLMCYNYNFSFREQCNRCQQQSKIQNQFQDFMLNVQQQQFKDKFFINDQQNYQDQNSFKNNINSKFQDLRIVTQDQSLGFQNQILLSPRHQGSFSSDFEMQSYQSPKNLPSLSPLIKHMAQISEDKRIKLQ